MKTYRIAEKLVLLAVCGGWIHWTTVYLGSLA